jgi:hypothetical protein
MYRKRHSPCDVPPASEWWPRIAVASTGILEGQMLGRRSHPRCVIPASLEGVLSVSRDVVVQAPDTRQVTVVSREAGVPGERGQLTPTGVNAGSVPVRVSTSHPVMIDGSIRHVLQLNLVLNGVPDAL